MSPGRLAVVGLGPGAPAWLYVRRALQGELRNPIQGWFGQRDLFEMAQGYDPAPGIVAWLTGTPGILALAAVIAAIIIATNGEDDPVSP